MPPAANRSNTSRARLGRRVLLACSALAGGVLLSPAPSHAAPTRARAAAVAAESAPSQAWTKAYAQKQWSVAIELLETIPENARTASHWLHLARAYEHSSQLVEAFAAYERVHDLTNDGTAAGLREVERQAKLESSELARRIPWAEVALAPGLPMGALIFVDQQWLEPARLRSPYPVNPGWHTFLVESNGEVLAARRTFFEEGQTRRVPLGAPQPSAALAPLPPSAPAAAAPEPPRPAPPSTDAPRPRTLTWRPDARPRPDAQPIDGDDGSSLLKASYVTLGVGALGTLVGTGFLFSTLNMRTGADDFDASCFNASCSPEARVEADDARRRWRAHATAATASYAIGLTGLIMGGVLLLLHRDSSSPASTVNIADLSLELAPRLSPHGATLRGTF